ASNARNSRPLVTGCAKPAIGPWPPTNPGRSFPNCDRYMPSGSISLPAIFPVLPRNGSATARLFRTTTSSTGHGMNASNDLRMSQIIPCLCAMAWLVSMATAVAADLARPPNVVLIVIDDLGWADLGCYGSRVHRTPTLHRLGARAIDTL